MKLFNTVFYDLPKGIGFTDTSEPEVVSFVARQIALHTLDQQTGEILPLKEVSVAKTPVAVTPVGETPVAKTPPAKTPPAKTPPAKTPPAKTPPAKTPVAKTPRSKRVRSGSKFFTRKIPRYNIQQTPTLPL